MQQSSLNAALEEANIAAPNKVGGNPVWESDTYTLTVVNANFGDSYGTPKIGMQVERSTDGKRHWFDLKFPALDKETMEEDAYRRAAVTLKMSGLKLKGLGLADAIARVAAEFPGDFEAQYSSLATAMIGVVFEGEITKQENNSNPANAVEADDPRAGELPIKKYINFLNNVTLVSGVTSDDAGTTGSGLSGLLG